MTAPPHRLWDAQAFAGRVRVRLGDTPLRTAAAEIGVSAATLCRVVNADPNISHENVLRVERWLAAGRRHKAAAA